VITPVGKVVGGPSPPYQGGVGGGLV